MRGLACCLAVGDSDNDLKSVSTDTPHTRFFSDTFVSLCSHQIVAQRLSVARIHSICIPFMMTHERSSSFLCSHSSLFSISSLFLFASPLLPLRQNFDVGLTNCFKSDSLSSSTSSSLEKSDEFGMDIKMLADEVWVVTAGASWNWKEVSSAVARTGKVRGKKVARKDEKRTGSAWLE